MLKRQVIHVGRIVTAQAYDFDIRNVESGLGLHSLCKFEKVVGIQ